MQKVLYGVVLFFIFSRLSLDILSLFLLLGLTLLPLGTTLAVGLRTFFSWLIYVI